MSKRRLGRAISGILNDFSKFRHEFVGTIAVSYLRKSNKTNNFGANNYLQINQCK